MSNLTDTQRDDLRRYAESINGSEQSYGATILRLMEENERLRSLPSQLTAGNVAQTQIEALSAEKIVFTDLINASTELAAQRLAERDAAYSERDKLVCALAKFAAAIGWDAWVGQHEIGASETEWDGEWMNVVYVQLPHGQVSWHIHDSELDWFSFLPRRETPGWDGHTSVEKYARLALVNPGDLQDVMHAGFGAHLEEQLRTMREHTANLQMEMEISTQTMREREETLTRRVALMQPVYDAACAQRDEVTDDTDAVFAAVDASRVTPDCVTAAQRERPAAIAAGGEECTRVENDSQEV